MSYHQKSVFSAVFLALAISGWAQSGDGKGTSPVSPKAVVVTGNRFTYKLVQKWIDEYNKIAPQAQIIIESRGSSDPAKFDILTEVYTPDQETSKTREYLYVGRYAVLPVATAKSAFANYFTDKGLTAELIKQIFFNDMFADKEKQEDINAPYTIYTRQQKAGVPLVFAKYFGYQQTDIKGTSIAGSDEHLLKALLRDPNGVTYLPLTLIYDQQTRKPVEGLAVLPVDLTGNGRVNDDEKFYVDLDNAIEQLEKKNPSDIKNIPVEYLHLSVSRETASPEAIDFLKWVNENGQVYLHQFGYLLPEAKYFQKEKFVEFAAKRNH
ncbi:MAG TPA: hypothetical protein VIU12_28720 [Chryseolinea sp.]